MKKRISTVVVLLALVLAMCFLFGACQGEAGKSAYQIACDNGFVGSEQQWLDSLVGKNGTDGKDGTNGTDGTNGSGGTLDTIEYATAKGMQSVVSVYSTFSSQSALDYSGAGAGVVYKIEEDFAYIITNYHVIYDSESQTTEGIAHTIELFPYGFEYTGFAVQAQFEGGSISRDIAIVKAHVADFAGEVKAAEIADSNKINLGEKVVAIGNPLANGFAVTSGIVSVDSENIQMEALDSPSDSITLRVIRTDTAINKGNSGGGLFNQQGRLVGIVNAKTIQIGVEGMGYAIPVNVAIGVAECVLENNSKKCVLGISVSAVTSTTQYNSAQNRIEIIETITVSEITTTLAQGKLLVGDLILAAQINNGEKFRLTRIFQLPDYLFHARPGDKIYLEIQREGTVMTIELAPTADNFTAV